MVDISVKDLNKFFVIGENLLQGLSFDIQEGECVAILGRNGCGKTTLIKILTGLIKDHTGMVRIDNEEPGVHTKSIIAYLPEKSYLPDWMRPCDALDYFADFYKDFDRDKAEKMVNKFGLDMKQRLKTMSKGQQEKLRLVLVMCRRAKLYILDEPSIGLHQRDNDKLLNSLKELRDLGNTLIVVEHDEDTMNAADYIVDVGPGYQG